jgi:hypothetical protein
MAQRDLACTYSVGFYVDDAVEDRPKNLTIRVRRPGVQVIHPNKYLFRSDSARQESLLRAAWVSPGASATGAVRAHLFPLRPASKTSWEALLAVSFPAPVGEPAGWEVEREIGAVVYQGPKIVHRFSRRITLRGKNSEPIMEREITFLERLKIKPGAYALTAVISDPGEVDPHSVRVAIDVPEIPSDELFLIGPILGRHTGPNVVVMGGETEDNDSVGREHSFEPLLVQWLDEPADLAALTQACVVSAGAAKKKPTRPLSIQRSLRGLEGSMVGSLRAVGLSLEGEGAVRCQSLVDIMPGAALGTGEYVFEARVDTGSEDENVEGNVRFAIGTPQRDPILRPNRR